MVGLPIPMSNIQPQTPSRHNSSEIFSDTESLLVQAQYTPTYMERYMFRRRYAYYVIGAVFLLFMFSGLMNRTRIHEQQIVVAPESEEEYQRLFAVVGPPTAKFRDNLRPNLKYITSWLDAGWSNDVITYMNLIYLGIITERIPLIGMFTPTHIGYKVENVDFGTVFDIPRLSKLINWPILEWHEVKDRNSTQVDELGCWDIWSTVEMVQSNPRKGRLVEFLNLDVSYTKTPTWVKTIPNYEHDRHATFYALASLSYPETRIDNLANPVITESPNHHVRLPPDQQLLCYDYLYYTAAHFPFEFEYDYSPAWRRVGRHMRWNATLEKLADQYIRRAMGIEASTEPTPLYISIHVRHRDFEYYCNDQPLSECFASFDVIGRRVDEVRQELKDRKGIDVKHVIMTSDERNASWWDGVREKGWYILDHSQTVELHGHWYPVLIDAVTQSNGMGFVGTDMSTMSTMARRRVGSWHDGPTRLVKWGRPGADDH